MAAPSDIFSELAAQPRGGEKDIFDFLAEEQAGIANAPVMTAAEPESIFTRITRPIRESLSPILGPSEERVMRESIPVIENGQTSYQYKPLGDRFAQEGLLAPIARTEDVIADIPILAPQEDDGGWTSAARGLGRGVVGVANSLTSPVGAPLMATGATEVNALRSGVAIPEVILAANRVAAGGFAASMIPTIPEQVSGLYNSQNAGEVVERTIGLAGTGLGVVGGTIAARSPRHAQAEVARQSDLPATAEVLQRQGDEEISLTKTPDIFDQLANETEENTTLGTVTPEEQATDALIAQNAEGAPVVEPAVTSDVPVSEVTQPEITNELPQSDTGPVVGASDLQAQQRIQNAIELVAERTPSEESGARSGLNATEEGKQQLASVETELPVYSYSEIEKLPLERSDTTEHEVRYNPETDQSIKLLKPDSFGMTVKFDPEGGASIEKATFNDYLNRIRLSNEVFGTDYDLKGIVHIADELDDARIIPVPVVSQKWHDPANTSKPHPEQAKITEYMEKLGFKKEPRNHSWSREEDGIYVADAKPDNFIETENGIVPIDLLITQRETQTNKPNETNTIPEIDIPATESGTDLVQDARENSQAIGQEERNQTVEQVAEIAPTGEEGASLVNLGPGAANAQEFTEMPVKTTSLSNAQTNAERAARGELPLMLEETQSNQSTFDQAESILEANPNAGRDTVVRILEADKPQINEIDEGILAHEKIRLENEKQMEADRASDPNTSEIEREQAAKRWEELELQQTQLDQAVRRAGTIAGRALQFRQRQIRDDFTLSAMEQKARVAKGRPLTPEEAIEIKTQADEITAQQAKVDESAARVEQQEREKALEATIIQLKEKLKTKAPTLDKRVLDYATKIVEGWKTEAEKARLRMMQRAQTSFGAGLDQDTLVDLTIIARARIGEGLLNAGNFAKELVAEYGEFVRPYAQQAWDAAQEQLNNIGKELPKVVREKVKKAIVTTPEAIVNRITETMKTRLAEGGDISSLKGLVDRLALEFVRQGINTREPLLDAVHAVLQALIPDLQKQQTSDLISGYGQFKTLDKEAAKVTLRGLKGELQQIAKIQDIQAKLAPKKTGIERRTPTTEERALIRQVNDLKKKGGFEVTDPEQQLKTALGAIQTRLRNEIDDFDNAILNKDPIVRENGKIDYDDETKALQAQRDAKKAEYDELFPKAPQTEEQQIAIALKSLDRSIVELQQNLKEGKLYSTSKRNTLTSPELVAKRAELESLREDRQLLRDLDTARIEAQKEAQLLKAIDDLEAGRKQPNTGVDTVESKRITELREQLQKLRDARDEAPEARQRQIDKALVIAKALLEDANKRLEEGGTSRAGKEPLRSDELDNIRMERDAVNAAIRALQEAAKPKKSPEEIRLQFRKAVIARQMAEYERRIAAKEFEPKKREPVELDEEGKKAEFELEQIKERFNKARLLDRIASRNKIERFFDTSADVVNLARAVQTGLDLSGVLRQGGILSLANPKIAVKTLPKMFKAFHSEFNRFNYENAIKKRENYPLYKTSGLALTERGTTLRAMEELYQSRWIDAELPPVIKNLPVIGKLIDAARYPIAGSSRAYGTFLNQMRVEIFDSLTDALGGAKNLTKDQNKIIANFVNVATGRGPLGVTLEQAAVPLNVLFFAPKYAMSRFQFATAYPIWAGLVRGKMSLGETAKARKLISQQYARYLAGVSVYYGAILAAQYAAGKLVQDGEEPPDPEATFNPLSSSFGKIKVGNTYIDPLAGLAQATVFMSRLATGETMTGKGEIVPLRDNLRLLNFFREAGDPLIDAKVGQGKFSPTIGKTIGKFLRSKFSPMAGATYNTITGTDYAGEPTDAVQEAMNLVTPMSIPSVVEALEDQGMARGTIDSLLSIFGANVATYNLEEKEAKKLQLTP